MRLLSDDIAPFVRALGLPVQAPEVVELRTTFTLQEDAAYHVTYFESAKHGIALAAEAGKVCAVFLFAHGKDEFEQYKGTLPLGIAFDWSQERVRAALGAPAKTASADTITKTLAHGGWDKYVLPECCLHLTYAPDAGRIELVTLEVAE